MAFVKLVKNNAYFKRFQVKYRRRREGKTDYYARRRMVYQDKNKYNSPKYRLVARITNKDIIAQVTVAKIVGDHVICSAYAHELPRYGLKAGITNYAAAYATGLLCARRLLKSLGLDSKYAGQTSADGELFHVEPVDDAPRPFRALLDVGLARTTTGHRVFGVLKGAVDGGMDIPHNEKRFPGYEREEKSYQADIHKKYIFGGHVAEYMEELQDEDADAYNKQFSRYVKLGLSHSDIEPMFQKVHAAIRANPAAVKTTKKVPKTKKDWKKRGISLAQRKSRVKQVLDARRRATAQ